jgi:DNA-binding response OmpR family regulator
MVMNHSTKKQILFVDDDKDTRDLMITLLGMAGHHTVVASGVAEGFQFVREQDFDFILLDWHLEDGSGIDLCRWIRCIDEQTPIFFYTGVAYPSEREKALAAGAQGYFIKPVNFDVLLQAIDEWQPNLYQTSECSNPLHPQTPLLQAH